MVQAKGHSESNLVQLYWLPCSDGGTFRISAATISQGREARTGCSGAGLLA